MNKTQLDKTLGTIKNYMNGNFISKSGGSVTGNIIPATNNTNSIGTSSNKWNSVNATNINATSMYATTFYGALNGNALTASSAAKLTTARNIIIGNKTNSFNGTGNITFTLSDIGAAASGHTHNYAGSSSAGGVANSSYKLEVKANNTITSTANDTTANWGTHGNSVHWYTNTGQLIDQPSQWGYLLNIGKENEVHQLWMTQSSGDMKHRGGNVSGWSGTWRTILDSVNYSSYVLPLTGGTISGNLTVNGTLKSGSALLASADGTDLLIGSNTDGSSVNSSTTITGTSTIVIGQDSVIVAACDSEGNLGDIQALSETTSILSDNVIIGNLASGTTTLSSPKTTVSGTIVSGKIKSEDISKTNSDYTTALGQNTTAYSKASFAAGYKTVARGLYSAAFGFSSNIADTSITNKDNVESAWNNSKFVMAFGNYSFTTGGDTLALGQYSQAVGYRTVTYADYSFAAGCETRAGGTASFAAGYKTKASGNYSFAIGHSTTASGYGAFAGGMGSTATGSSSTTYPAYALGYYSTAGIFNFTIGKYNKAHTAGTLSGTGGEAFLVGNGTKEAVLSNAFKVNYTGDVYAGKTINGTGADYAEYFEWQDGNIKGEDRRGYFVTLDEEKIRIAKTGEYILGIVSAQPAVLGNSDIQWKGQYLFDDFGSYQIERVKVLDEDTNEEIIEERYVLNPDYDPEKSYTPRAIRNEWDAIGLVGALVVRDDGTCKVNGYCQCNDEGIATASETGYRVMKRINEYLVKVLFR